MNKLKSRITRQEQMSEAFVLSVVLAFSGGFQDAYTYIVRDSVFANAQTGNVVLMSTYLMDGRWTDALRYMLPLLAFIVGVFIAENIQHYFKKSRRLHWRQGVLIVEFLIMLLVGFLPQRVNLLANILVSLACAMQVQSFRTVGGNIYASTMCIGNLRSGTAALSAFVRRHSRADLQKVLYYFGVILSFALGAGIGGNLSSWLGVRTIWITCAFLCLGFFLMELDRTP